MPSRKGKSGAPVVVIAGVIAVVVIGGVFAASHDWKSGRNGIVDYFAAQSGDVEAQFRQGQAAWASGPEDRPQAIQWYEKAATEGHVPSMMALGAIFDKSDKTRDGDAAMKWYLKAAEAGNVEAMRLLGLGYIKGRGTPDPDLAKGLVWLEKSASAGDRDAAFELGKHYYNQNDGAKAEPWLEKAATAGRMDAYLIMANIRANPDMGRMDIPLAATYYAKAAQADIADAQLRYSHFLYNGRGMKKDRAEAYKWVLLAADQRNIEALSAVDYFKLYVDKKDLTEGETRAANWRKTYRPQATQKK